MSDHVEMHVGTERWAEAPHAPRSITGVACLFGVRCGNLVTNTGGLDEHHPDPKFLGGQEHGQTLAYLCKNHHTRQHSLIRALIEGRQIGDLASRFQSGERDMAFTAYNAWVARGRPHVASWNVAAAT